MLNRHLRAALIVAALATSTAAVAATLEVSLKGLNCALCSEELKAKLAHMSGARGVEARLECGQLYLDMAPGAALDEHGLSQALLTNGFTLEAVKPVNMTFAQVKALPDC